jgi:N-acetylmuramoyl-L-alanine amidase
MAKKIVLLMFLLGLAACNTVQMNKFNQPVEQPNLSAQQPVQISMEGTLLKAEWLRSAPSYRGTIIKKLSTNSTVVISRVDGDWYYMQSSAQSTEGWLPSKLVLISIQGTDNQSYNGRIHKEVNIRSGPGTDHQKVGVASVASPVQIVSANKNWYQVNVMTGQPPKSGWIRSDFVTVNLPHPSQ